MPEEGLVAPLRPFGCCLTQLRLLPKARFFSAADFAACYLRNPIFPPLRCRFSANSFYYLRKAASGTTRAFSPGQAVCFLYFACKPQFLNTLRAKHMIQVFGINTLQRGRGRG